jgi:4-hydroxyphenylpyruvate dioxygenase
MIEPDRLAINAVTTDHDGIEEALAAYEAAGFGAVEFDMGEVEAYLADHDREDIAALLDRHGLDAIGGIGGAADCFGDDSVRENADLVENADVLADLGAETMVVGTDGPEEVEGVEVLEAYADAFAALADAVDVTLCVEFNWSPVVRSLRSAATISRRAGDGVGVLFDPAHYHCTPAKLSELTPENVREVEHVHVDDMRDKPGELSDCNADRVLPGEGHLDLDELFGRIEPEYDGYYAAELFNDQLWALPAEEAARRTRESLRRFEA